MLVPIPALNDNYIWLYRRENFPVIVIDIPEITCLIPYLESNKLGVEAVLLTHNHDDHVQGVAEFKQYYPNVPVFGPTECANKGATNIVDTGVINTAHYHIEVLPSGGHTAGHVSYLVDGHLFAVMRYFLVVVDACSREILLKCLNLCSVLTNYQMKPWFARLMNIRWVI